MGVRNVKCMELWGREDWGWGGQERLHREVRNELGPEGWLRFKLVIQGARGPSRNADRGMHKANFQGCESEP